MSFLWRDVAPLVRTARPVLALSRPFDLPLARRHVLAGLALGTALAASSRAQRAFAADGDADGAKQFVNTTAGQAIAIMADKSAPLDQQAAKFRTLFDASFDLPAIGQLVLGRHWKSATDDQKQKFLALFEQQEVLIWAHRFKTYSGQRLTVQSAAADASAPGRMRVESQIDDPSGPIPLEWQVEQSGGAWRIVDLTVSNASMALTIRQDFDSVLSANGGKLDALLAAMQKKIDQLKTAS